MSIQIKGQFRRTNGQSVQLISGCYGISVSRVRRMLPTHLIPFASEFLDDSHVCVIPSFSRLVKMSRQAYDWDELRKAGKLCTACGSIEASVTCLDEKFCTLCFRKRFKRELTHKEIEL